MKTYLVYYFGESFKEGQLIDADTPEEAVIDFANGDNVECVVMPVDLALFLRGAKGEPYSPNWDDPSLYD
jgi:hypothetical protein